MLYTTYASLNNTPKLDPIHWNSLIKHQAKSKNDQAILDTFSQMQILHISPDFNILPLILKACTKLQAIETGKRIHSNIKGSKLEDNVRVRASLVDFYGKCGFLEDARQVFDGMPERDVVLWNVMINSYVGCCQYEEAVVLFKRMLDENLGATPVTLVALLVACRELLLWRLGKEIHGYCLRNDYVNSYLGSALIGFYMEFDLRASRFMFNSMGMKSAAEWNAMMNAYLGVGDQIEALKLFVDMLIEGIECDRVSILAAIQACSVLGCLELAGQLHLLAIKLGYAQDLHIISALINVYGKTCSLESAYRIFESAPVYDIAIWNTMISACLENGWHEEGWRVFSRMESEGFRVNEATITLVLKICLEMGCESRVARSLHAKIITNGFSDNTTIVNAVLRIYAGSGCINDAMILFEKLIKPDVISWNIMISGLASNGLRNHAWNYFEKMLDSEIKPNSHTIIAVISICKDEDESYLKFGRALHGYVIKHGIEVIIELSTSLIEMYMDCADEISARNLFDRCSSRDVILWNSLISSYVRNNLAHEALPFFKGMLLEEEPNSITIINILSSCTDVASLPLGQCLHAYTIRKDYFGGLNLSLGNALLSMYARCGNMKNAERIFKSLQNKNISSWNALIAGYGLNGRVNDALHAYSRMLGYGFRPNERTLLSLLSACSHSGMVEKGLELFRSMVDDFKVTPMLIHYGSLVDLLGRVGYIDEAKAVISSMPFEPDASILRAFLSACRAHSDLRLAETVFRRLVELEPKNTGNYILLSNICANAGLWSEVRGLRMHLKEKGMKKNPGMSWIFVRNQVYCFVSGDQSCFNAAEVYATLESLLIVLKDGGYDPDLSWGFQDEEDG